MKINQKKTFKNKRKFQVEQTISMRVLETLFQRVSIMTMSYKRNSQMIVWKRLVGLEDFNGSLHYF
jgi:hypothetical protein